MEDISENLGKQNNLTNKMVSQKNVYNIADYLALIRYCVNQYSSHRLFTKEDKEDLFQELCLSCWAKWPKITGNFQPQLGVKFSYYLKVVVGNAYLDLLAQKRITLNSSSLNYQTLKSESQILNQDIAAFMDTEIDLLITCLKLYGKRLPKILLLLKAYYRLPIKSKDILAVYPKTKTQDLTLITAIFQSQEYGTLEIYNHLAKLYCRSKEIEGKAANLRVWFGRYKKDIINNLNAASSYGPIYDCHRLGVLLEEIFGDGNHSQGFSLSNK